ncbi:oligosaccharyl transferase stt3 subunit, partial [Linnemannia elongata]
MAALGVFGLLQLYAFAELVRGYIPPKQFRTLLKGGVAAVAVIASFGLTILSFSGVIAPFTGRFYSLYDTGYAKIHIPIIASVSEHQPTAWTSFFFDLQMLIFLFPAGVYLCFKELKDEHVFIILYSVFASYFAGVMVRLMLTLTPVVCVSAAIAYSTLLDTYLETSEHVLAVIVAAPPAPAVIETSTAATSETKAAGKKAAAKAAAAAAAAAAKSTDADAKAQAKSAVASGEKKRFPIFNLDSRLLVILQLTWFLFMFAWHCTYVTSGSYSSPSIVLASRQHDGAQMIIDDFREA